MPSTIACPGCGLTGQVPDGFAAPQVNCPRCGSTIPTGRQPSGNGSAPAESAPPAPPSAAVNPPNSADHRARLVDAFFMQAFNPRPAAPPPGPAPVPLPPRPTLSAPPADPGAEQQWLKEERQRLEDYLSKQFGLLQHRREELAAWQSRIEAALVSREQELNRLQKQLTAQEQTLKQREASVAALSSELQELEAKAAPLRQEVATLQARADSNRAQAAQLAQAAETARADIQKLQELKAEHESRQQLWQQRTQQLEGRQLALEKAEQTHQQRLAEWQELESQVRGELEQREQDLARERRILDEQAEQLRANQGAAVREESSAPPPAKQQAAPGELQQLETKLAQLRQEVASQQALANSKRAEADQFQLAAEAARAETQKLASSRDALLADLRQREQECQRRQAELAFNQQSADGDKVQGQLRGELEQRRQELAGSRRVLTDRWEQLKAAQKEIEGLRQKIGELTAELDRLRRPPAPPAPAAPVQIAFSCSKCGMQLKVKPEFAGRSTRCPTCKEPLVVPAAAGTKA
jgi:chromosome segregation ATPase/DNA-directed RNA polymerase subunit RPC12/RpoP